MSRVCPVVLPFRRAIYGFILLYIIYIRCPGPRVRIRRTDNQGRALSSGRNGSVKINTLAAALRRAASAAATDRYRRCCRCDDDRRRWRRRPRATVSILQSAALSARTSQSPPPLTRRPVCPCPRARPHKSTLPPLRHAIRPPVVGVRACRGRRVPVHRRRPVLFAGQAGPVPGGRPHVLDPRPVPQAFSRVEAASTVEQSNR